MVSALDSQSGGPGLEYSSGDLLDLLSVVPSSNSHQVFFKNSQLVVSCQLEIFVSVWIIFSYYLACSRSSDGGAQRYDVGSGRVKSYAGKNKGRLGRVLFFPSIFRPRSSIRSPGTG